MVFTCHDQLIHFLFLMRVCPCVMDITDPRPNVQLTDIFAVRSVVSGVTQCHVQQYLDGPLLYIGLRLRCMLPHSIYPRRVSFSFSSLSENCVASLINMFKVLRLRILFDVFLNVPAGQVGFQILFNHKIHGCLPSQKHKITLKTSNSILYGYFGHM